MSAADEDAETVRAFAECVNMTPHALEAWLATGESKEVGSKASPRSESTGHASGRAIVALLRKKKSEYTDDDRKHMYRVVAYIKRHLAQRPAGETAHTRWAYSLKNWGHDPAKHDPAK